MLRRRRIAGHAAPTPPTVIGTVDAPLICRPQLSGFLAGAEQRRNCAGWLRSASAHALPAIASETPIQAAIRAASDVRGVRSGLSLYHDALRLSRIYRDASQVDDFETGSG